MVAVYGGLTGSDKGTCERSNGTCCQGLFEQVPFDTDHRAEDVYMLLYVLALSHSLIFVITSFRS